MVQENRAFDNYLGVLAQYRVNHQPPIPGAQLSDVNDLHTLPSGYQHQAIRRARCFAPFHQRTECIENLSPSWDETHYDMDLVGDDWLNLTAEFTVPDGQVPVAPRCPEEPAISTIRRIRVRWATTIRPTCRIYYELATQFTTDDEWHSPIPANTIPNRMYLFAATSYGHAYPAE